ncbi:MULTISPECIES: hypothetical protein [Sorangium]|uniref:hypothetical protein n=1 Tax=Sorangium TaxID=39643 RepID=UPI003D9C40A8
MARQTRFEWYRKEAPAARSDQFWWNVSSVHDRWQLVEPLLLARALREPALFRRGATKRSRSQDLEAIRHERHLEDTAIAEAYNLLDDDALFTPDRDEPIHAHITRVAARWLVADGDHWSLRLDPRNPGHEIIRWRCVTVLLPPSIVSAGALSATGRSYPCWVQVLPDSIAPREPVGHLHVHLGPMLPFEALWSQLWNAFLKNGTLDARNGDGIDTIKGDEVPEIAKHTDRRRPGMLWQWILELAFAARVWLELPSVEPFPSVLRDFGRGQIDLSRRRGALLSMWSQPAWRVHARRDARRLAELRRQSARRAFLAAIRTVNFGAPRNDAAAQTPAHGDDEVAFIARCLRRCSSEPEHYAGVLYQYLRVKVALYGRLVVNPWNVGLRHFLDVVKRDGPYINVIDDGDHLEEVRLDAAWAEKPLRIGAAEIHVHPNGWLKRFPRAPHRHHRWIISFPRAEAPGKGDPEGARASRGWKLIARRAATTCRLLARCIAIRPSVLRELRGIGLMDWERNGPVWLFEPSLRRLLDASVEVAARHPRLQLHPIRTAFHLGEDFDHILSGLRQIFEPFEWGLIGRGDRIGHALALGLSPRAWCEQKPWIRMRPWDRILDIGFVHWAFETLRLQLDAGHIERMRLSAGDAVRRVFGDQVRDPLETARNLWLSLPRSAPRGAGGANLKEARQLLHSLLEERHVGRNALDLSVTVETRLDLPVIVAVHEAVRDRVTKAGVAVEINPSSNLLIGGFRSIFDQPVFHTDDFPIILNADDPLTFGTTLADDYAYAWAGMVIGSGQSPHQARRRLEEAARCSMRYLFSEPPTDEAIRDSGTRPRTP